MSLTESIRGWFATQPPITEQAPGISARDAASWIMENLGDVEVEGQPLKEAFTQADIELALDDRGWLVGGKRMMGELDPLSRQVQVNRSRYYWLRDPLAKQAVRLWTDYSFGDTAIGYTCEDDATQNQLDAFMKARANRRFTSREGMRRLSQRLLIDGELFFVINEADSTTNGKAPTVRTVDCLQITDIITDPDDEDKVVAYKRVIAGKNGTTKTLYYQPWDAEDDAKDIDPASTAADTSTLQPSAPQGNTPIKCVEGARMYHLAFDAIERRGNGLLSSCSDWAREHRRFMVARVALTQALSKFAFKTSVKGGQGVVNSIRAKLESTFSQSGLSGGTEHNPPAAPGANFLANEGVNIEAMPRVTGANEASADANGLKLMVSAGTGIMLHYFGDPSTGNLATATAMELPMLKMFKAYQGYWKDAWRDLFSIVLDEPDDIDQQAEISITLPEILEDDLQQLAAFLTSFTAVFPEAKVPALLKMCLESANVPDIDEVMEDIEDKKEELDAQAELEAKTTHNNALQLVQAKGNPTVPGSLKPGTPQTEADSIEALTAAFKNLTEVLR